MWSIFGMSQHTCSTIFWKPQHTCCTRGFVLTQSKHVILILWFALIGELKIREHDGVPKNLLVVSNSSHINRWIIYRSFMWQRRGAWHVSATKRDGWTHICCVGHNFGYWWWCHRIVCIWLEGECRKTWIKSKRVELRFFVLVIIDLGANQFKCCCLGKYVCAKRICFAAGFEFSLSLQLWGWMGGDAQWRGMWEIWLSHWVDSGGRGRKVRGACIWWSCL